MSSPRQRVVHGAMMGTDNDSTGYTTITVACWIPDCGWLHVHSVDYGVALDDLMDHLCAEGGDIDGIGHRLDPPAFIAVNL